MTDWPYEIHKETGHHNADGQPVDEFVCFVKEQDIFDSRVALRGGIYAVVDRKTRKKIERFEWKEGRTMSTVERLAV